MSSSSTFWGWFGGPRRRTRRLRFRPPTTPTTTIRPFVACAPRHGPAADPGSFGQSSSADRANGEAICREPRCPGVPGRPLVWSTELATLAAGAQRRECDSAWVRRMHHRGRSGPASSNGSWDTSFSKEDRHVRRIGMLSDYEVGHGVARGWPGERAVGGRPHPELPDQDLTVRTRRGRSATLGRTQTK